MSYELGAKKKLAIAIPIFFVLVFLGLLGYSYNQIQVSLNEVNLQSIEWEPLSLSTLLNAGLNVLGGNLLEAGLDLIKGINLNLIFGLSNNGFLPVYIPDISYDLFINGMSMGTGISEIDATILPGQTKVIVVLQNFEKISLTPAISSIISSEGIIDLKVSGTAYFNLLGLDVPIPFESSKQISISDEIENYLGSQQGKETKIS
jgi:hypothetical protein